MTAVVATVPIAAGPYAPTAECVRCHPLIGAAWQESAHARSSSSPAFLRAVGPLLAAREAAECLRCHAPAAAAREIEGAGGLLVTGGIGCDFCHTLATVGEPPARAGMPSLDNDPGPVKRGPLRNPESTWHDAAFSSLFVEGAALCASCHEYRNGAGVAVLTSWSEWRESPWPGRKVSCRDCHMPLEPGTPADRAVAGASRRSVSLHRFAGADSRSRLHHALDLEIVAVSRDGLRLAVTVAAVNRGAGHSVPGGLPGRSLVLAVGVDTGEATLAGRQERAWRRVVLDREGRVLEGPADIILRGAADGPDTRLRAGETRNETFDLDLPQGARAVVARLEYRDQADAGAPKSFLVSEIRRNLAP
jgi:hypothetical protein